MRRRLLKDKKKRIYLRISLKRFQNRVKRNKYKICKKKNNSKEYAQNSPYREIGKNIGGFQDTVRHFLPPNLSYMITNKECLFYSKKTEQQKKRFKYVLEVPKVFSIITNPDDSYSFLQKLVSMFIYQSCQELWVDYHKCIETDLLTQVFLDAILLDIDKYHKQCKKARVCKYINLNAIGGCRYDNENICRMVNSVGSPTVLINRTISYREIVPFRLRYFDALNAPPKTKSAQKEIDVTNILEYVNKCLKRVNKTLTKSALREMGYVAGETLINAEEHSSLNSRYTIGYFEECDDNTGHYGVLNLVIMNFGQSIYEKFKYPRDEHNLNIDALEKMQALSSHFTKKHFFGHAEFTEETLWTLYSLQKGVTCVPHQSRGSGTIQFIESFFKLKGNEIDDISRMYILSGKTVIEFDGTYRLSGQKDSNGVDRGIISFNSTGKLEDKPDTKYVKSVKNYFPGTAIFVKILLNEEDIKNEN